MKLDASVKELPYVGDSYAKKLAKLDIETVEDLLLHIPHRYLDFRETKDVGRAKIGETITLQGKIVSSKNVYTRTNKTIQIIKVKDKTGIIQAVWFNQPYLVKTFKKGETVKISGEVKTWQRKKALLTPEYEFGKKNQDVHTGRLVPIYPETAGISSKWLRRRIKDAYKKVHYPDEFLPRKLLRKLKIPEIKEAITKIHFPKSKKEAKKGRQRMAFNELLFLQLKGFQKKIEWKKENASYPLRVKEKEVDKLIESLPFKLTKSQKVAIDDVLSDMRKDVPMNRLLEGDVGSGKTIVAAVAAYAAFKNSYQSVLMAPTQILAKQHFTTLKNVLSSFKVDSGLLTSGGLEASSSSPDVLVGTHALFYNKVSFDKTALVIIDEQHRFGVKQRRLIAKKSNSEATPHILTMTATPIPRTVALTIYNDLDLSTLKELPKGRRPITTRIVPPEKRSKAYNWIQEQIKEKEVQAFVICPLIEESDKETMKQVKAATVEYQKLKNKFPDLSIGLLHGKLDEKEKNSKLENFKKGKSDILVATPVVEVGIDVPNATIMVIEGAERFGLAQLHQLRGRVGRGEKKSYCFLFTKSKTKKVLTRLSSLKKTMSGFELAELDLELRGPGEVFGTKQHGFSELKIASWRDTDLIKKARQVAREALNKPEKYKKLAEKIESMKLAPN